MPPAILPASHASVLSCTLRHFDRLSCLRSRYAPLTLCTGRFAVCFHLCPQSQKRPHVFLPTSFPRRIVAPLSHPISGFSFPLRPRQAFRTCVRFSFRSPSATACGFIRPLITRAVCASLQVRIGIFGYSSTSWDRLPLLLFLDAVRHIPWSPLDCGTFAFSLARIVSVHAVHTESEPRSPPSESLAIFASPLARTASVHAMHAESEPCPPPGEPSRYSRPRSLAPSPFALCVQN